MGGGISSTPRRSRGALNDAMLSALFRLNSLGATDDAFDMIESARASWTLLTLARPLPAVCVARRVRVACRVSSAATLFWTEGRTVDLRGETGLADEVVRSSAMERVARSAGEGDLTTLRAGDEGDAGGGDMAGWNLAVVPEAIIGETRGEARDGLRAAVPVRELSYELVDSDGEAALSRDRVEAALRRMPGFRLSDAPEGVLRNEGAPLSPGTADSVPTTGGVGRGRPCRAGDASLRLTLWLGARAGDISARALTGEAGVAKANFSDCDLEGEARRGALAGGESSRQAESDLLAVVVERENRRAAGDGGVTLISVRSVDCAGPKRCE